jgi:hypothetical protein
MAHLGNGWMSCWMRSGRYTYRKVVVHTTNPVWRGAQGGNISRPGSSSRGDARISRDGRQSPKESTAGSAARHFSGSRTGDSDTGFRDTRMSSISRSWPDPGWLIQGV